LQSTVHNNSDYSGFPLIDADKCVKCALCLPHCPTWQETHDEADSPRGRISLMQGVATGALQPNDLLDGHLDRCLTCRACEAVCPAEVPYGRLIDSARAELQANRPPPAMRLARLPFHHRPLMAAGTAVLWLAQRLQLMRLVEQAGPAQWRRLARMLPRLQYPRPRGLKPSARSDDSRAVMLFRGCIEPFLDPRTQEIAVALLERLGVSVHIPENQGCCGALDSHNGEPDAARRLAHANVRAFDAHPDLPCVGTASGCTATLLEYDEIIGTSAENFTRRISDINAYVEDLVEEKAPAFKPLRQTVLLHTPCTLRNILKKPDVPATLLNSIPELTIERLPPACCGAAGSYMLTQPDMSDRLVARVVDQARELRPDLIATSNIGCMLHMRGALKAAGLDIPVKHPIELIAQQLDDPVS
jgi:glycolate oxidase iron-sulfur subunit